jgi:hypothetical protein
LLGVAAVAALPGERDGGGLRCEDGDRNKDDANRTLSHDHPQGLLRERARRANRSVRRVMGDRVEWTASIAEVHEFDIYWGAEFDIYSSCLR